MAAKYNPKQFMGIARNNLGRFMAKPPNALYAGTWDTMEEAALARDRVVLHLGLERDLNFPTKSRKLGPASPAEMVRAARETTARTKILSNGFLGVALTAQRRFTATPAAGLYAGFWDTPEEAALARDRVVLHFGLERVLNFPEQSRALGPASPEEMVQAAHEARAAKQTSHFRGVHLDVKRGLWAARAYANGKTYALGRFENEIDAARAHDEAMWDLKGKLAVLNFEPPQRRPTGKPPRSRALPKTSRYRGVAKQALTGKCVAQLWVKGVMQSAGMYVSEEDAAEAHDRLCLHFGLPREELNFPNRKLQRVAQGAARRSAACFQRDHHEPVPGCLLERIQGILACGN